MNNKTLNDNAVILPAADTAKVEHGEQLVSPGQWYWVQDQETVYNEDLKEHEEQPYEWLGCVMRVGSNFIELREPNRNGYRHIRVHFDDFYSKLRFEPNHEQVIAGKVQHFQTKAAEHLEEIKRITAKLGVLRNTIGHEKPQADTDTGNRALMVLSQAPDIKGYQRDLVLAKEKQLPDLFKEVEEANGEVVRWLSATALPLLAQKNAMDGVIEDIEDRIFNVSLYAGLTEEVVKCCDGKPAEPTDKLHVMQRRLYMDEECLLNYRVGGMEFTNIQQFDAWISEPVNRDRILPHPRTLVAMRVRRTTKKRDWDGSFSSALIQIQLERADKFTFLYIRNGERVYRLSCELDFGDSLIPDRTEFDPSERMMVELFANRVKRLVRYDEYKARLDLHLAHQAKRDKWFADNPEETWDKDDMPRWMANPYRDGAWDFRPDSWQPFDPSSVYFDDATNELAAQIKQYNRIALIIQGLFDRSDVLHPHPPVRVWNPDSFASAIKLVYDGSEVLENGEAPDFEAYRAACNASLNENSVVIGQEDVFLIREADKENKRIDNSWRDRTKYHHEKFRPYGNPGPGYLAKIAEWKPRTRKATFVWHRDRQHYKRYGSNEPITTRLTVSADDLFNVSAYKKGDYLQFFKDHRTRAQYLKWAPMLLTAEEFVAGNISPTLPVDDGGEQNIFD